jgi:hypothetical protein
VGLALAFFLTGILLQSPLLANPAPLPWVKPHMGRFRVMGIFQSRGKIRFLSGSKPDTRSVTEAPDRNVCLIALEKITKIGFTATFGDIQSKGASVVLTLRKTQTFQTYS